MENKEIKEAEVVNEIPSDLSFEQKTLKDISLEIAEYVVEKENEKELFPKKYSRLDVLEAASKIQEKLLNSNEFRENVKKTVEKDVKNMMAKHDNLYPILKTFKIYYEVENFDYELDRMKDQEVNSLATEFGYILGKENLGENFENVDSFNSFCVKSAKEFLNSDKKDYQDFIINKAKNISNNKESEEDEYEQ